MSTADASKSAGATGIELRFDGDDFALSAAAAPHAAVLDALFQHKIGIVALLRPGRDGWSAEDWQAYFDERAGVAEFAGGLSRAEAEAHARVLRCGVVDPQLRSLALRPLCRMRRSRATPRSASALRTEADRLRLAAFELLASLARKPQRRCGRRPIGNPEERLMGKRSNFERREADFYPTPRAAVVPLIPYILGSGIRTFAEPCAGDGALGGAERRRR